MAPSVAGLRPVPQICLCTHVHTTRRPRAACPIWPTPCAAPPPASARSSPPTAARSPNSPRSTRRRPTSTGWSSSAALIPPRRTGAWRPPAPVAVWSGVRIDRALRELPRMTLRLDTSALLALGGRRAPAGGRARRARHRPDLVRVGAGAHRGAAGDRPAHRRADPARRPRGRGPARRGTTCTSSRSTSAASTAPPACRACNRCGSPTRSISPPPNDCPARCASSPSTPPRSASPSASASRSSSVTVTRDCRHGITHPTTLHWSNADVEVHKVVVGPSTTTCSSSAAARPATSVLIDAANEHELLLELCQALERAARARDPRPLGPHRRRAADPRGRLRGRRHRRSTPRC